MAGNEGVYESNGGVMIEKRFYGPDTPEVKVPNSANVVDVVLETKFRVKQNTKISS